MLGSLWPYIEKHPKYAEQGLLDRWGVIVDTANDESAENWRAAVKRADALVVPIKWRNDYSLPAVEMLEEIPPPPRMKLE